MAALSRLLFKRLLHLDFWSYIAVLLVLRCVASCCFAVCRSASERLWAQAGPTLLVVSLLPPSLETSNPCWAERTPADLSPVPGGGEDVSCELEGENQALRDEISDQRVWRPKRCQTPRRPSQMHVVPQQVGKMQRDCLGRRQKGPRWECGVGWWIDESMIFKGCLKRSCWDTCTKKMWDWHAARATKKQREKHRDCRGRLCGSGDISESDHWWRRIDASKKLWTEIYTLTNYQERLRDGVGGLKP